MYIPIFLQFYDVKIKKGGSIMPNIWTHNLFGDQVAKQSTLFKHSANSQDKHIFHLGCQGPDFLFYHRFFPWQGTSPMNELGTRMHQEVCGPVLLTMAKHVKEQHTSVNDPLAHYVLGFMMHHVLDRNMHPYVFCKSGSVKWNHQRFEVIIDTIVVKKMLDLDTWSTPAWKQIYIGPELPNQVPTLMEFITETYYPDIHPHIDTKDWNIAYQDMIQAQRIFHDPYGIKRLLTFGQIEPLVYKRRNDDLDYLNEAHIPWRHPAVPAEISTASFWDLWDQAMIDGLNVWQAAEAYMFSEQDASAYDRLVDVIGNLSYEHGKSCDDQLKIHHEEPIWL